MGRDTIRLLIVEDSYEYAQMLKTVLLAEETVNFDITHCENLHEALNYLHQGDFETILLDLSLPDSLGLDTFLVIHDEAPEIPVVVITALDDASVAIRAVRHGAQDYLVKGDLDVSNLVRSLRYAVERQHTLMMIEQMTLVDDLTGL